MQNLKEYSKLAQSASALGAGLLGFALGAIWGAGLNNTLLYSTLIVGAVLHVVGMYVIQLRNKEAAGTIAKILWVTAWICLLALIGIFIYLDTI